MHTKKDIDDYMNDQFIQGVIFDWDRIDNDSYLKKIAAFQGVKKLDLLLKMNNFVIEKIYDYDRPTPLKDGERGLANWMRQFFASDLETMTEMMHDEIVKRVENLTKESLWNGREWVADYRRLRAIAHT